MSKLLASSSYFAWFLETVIAARRERWVQFIKKNWPSLNYQDCEEIYGLLLEKLLRCGLRVLGNVTDADVQKRGSIDAVLESRVFAQLRWGAIKYSEKADKEIPAEDLYKNGVPVSFSIPKVSGEELSFLLKRKIGPLSEREGIFIDVICREKVVYVDIDRNGQRVCRFDLGLFYKVMTPSELKRMAPGESFGTPLQEAKTKREISRVKNRLKGKIL
ncbi:MAG: hypothetical protein ACPGN3_15975 [Opitutales bacterium]